MQPHFGTGTRTRWHGFRSSCKRRLSLCCLLCWLALMPACLAQPLQRNPFTTNPPNVTIVVTQAIVLSNSTPLDTVLDLDPSLNVGSIIRVGAARLTTISANQLSFDPSSSNIKLGSNGPVLFGSATLGGSLVLQTQSGQQSTLRASNTFLSGQVRSDNAIFTNTYTWFGSIIADDATTTYSVSNTTVTLLTNFHLHALNGVGWDGLGTLTNQFAGFYHVFHNETFAINNNNQTIEHQIWTNGVDSHNHTEQSFVNASARASVGNQNIIFLPANTLIQLYASNHNGTCTMTNRELSMTIKKL